MFRFRAVALAAFARLERNFDQLRQLTKDVSKRCSDFDFRELRTRINELETGSRSAPNARLQSAVGEYRASGFPFGYQALPQSPAAPLRA